MKQMIMKVEEKKTKKKKMYKDEENEGVNIDVKDNDGNFERNIK